MLTVYTCIYKQYEGLTLNGSVLCEVSVNHFNYHLISFIVALMLSFITRSEDDFHHGLFTRIGELSAVVTH